ncbi:MAG: 50S ribosomal protein L5 [Mycoplasma sp.]
MKELKKQYINEIVPALQKEFNLKSIMQVPKLEKIVINAGIGDAAQDSKNLDAAVKELEIITGQKPLITRAKKSIATYKVREGQGIGTKVTLRGDKMWDFLTMLVNVALPRVRDFRGLNPNSFDGRGNYTIGIKEQIIFPQIVYDDVKRIRGYDITFVTSTDSNEQALSLLLKLGAPIRKVTK